MGSIEQKTSCIGIRHLPVLVTSIVRRACYRRATRTSAGSQAFNNEGRRKPDAGRRKPGCGVGGEAKASHAGRINWLRSRRGRRTPGCGAGGEVESKDAGPITYLRSRRGHRTPGCGAGGDAGHLAAEQEGRSKPSTADRTRRRRGVRIHDHRSPGCGAGGETEATKVGRRTTGCGEGGEAEGRDAGRRVECLRRRRGGMPKAPTPDGAGLFLTGRNAERKDGRSKHRLEEGKSEGEIGTHRLIRGERVGYGIGIRMG